MPAQDPIEALVPDGPGHQFVLYGDSCSGVPGALHEANLAKVNSVVGRFEPQPEFILFPGDEIIGLTADETALRAQWRHFFDREMAWLDRKAVPLYHTTGNHTAYDRMSEHVFADIMSHLPRNGPQDQPGLSYFVRRGDLLMVFVNTTWSGLGGEGYVETDWLEATLRANHDARWKLVIGHHPVFPVNGYSGPCQRTIAAGDADEFWRILREHSVMAYLCSHILAFDVQVHDGILQITTAGAGTAHRMPEGTEYLHCVQAAIDAQGLRYRVFDETGRLREQLAWPPRLPPSPEWLPLNEGVQPAPAPGRTDSGQAGGDILAWRFRGKADAGADGARQTLLAAFEDDAGLMPLWIGLSGREQRLTVIIGPDEGKSPHYWFGPALAGDAPFDVQLAIHGGMGPGGIMWRAGDDAPWTSLAAASPWGAERLSRPSLWSVGRGKGKPPEAPYSGADLAVSYHADFGAAGSGSR